MAKVNEALIRSPSTTPDAVLWTLCDHSQVVVALVPTANGEHQILPIKGTDLLKASASGIMPKAGTFERMTAIYAKSEAEAAMLATIFGDGGLDGPVDSDMRRMLTDHVVASAKQQWVDRAASTEGTIGIDFDPDYLVYADRNAEAVRQGEPARDLIKRLFMTYDVVHGIFPHPRDHSLLTSRPLQGVKHFEKLLDGPLDAPPVMLSTTAIHCHDIEEAIWIGRQYSNDGEIDMVQLRAKSKRAEKGLRRAAAAKANQGGRRHG
ncbi:MAG: hypothetical protein K2Z25_16415 [Beijerinckiaceae bacterium]|nr:hypothetical protein [Beijerinckiaceae bacterium]